MLDNAALAARIAERRAFIKEHSRWGLLPPQRGGVGLVVSVVSIVSLVAVLAAFVFGFGGAWSVPLLLVTVVANLANIIRTKRWLDAQLGS